MKPSRNHLEVSAAGSLAMMLGAAVDEAPEPASLAVLGVGLAVVAGAYHSGRRMPKAIKAN
jgi:hypothetical protein